MHIRPKVFQWFGGQGASPARRMPPTAPWRTMDRFAGPLDADGCSADFWIRKGPTEIVAFFCDRTFDGLPPGWFDTFGDPIGFVPEFFRPVDD